MPASAGFRTFLSPLDMAYQGAALPVWASVSIKGKMNQVSRYHPVLVAWDWLFGVLITATPAFEAFCPMPILGGGPLTLMFFDRRVVWNPGPVPVSNLPLCQV